MNEDSGHNLRDTTTLLEKAYQDEQRKIIEEFIDFFIGGNDFLKFIGTTKEKLIDDYFNSRK